MVLPIGSREHLVLRFRAGNTVQTWGALIHSIVFSNHLLKVSHVAGSRIQGSLCLGREPS